MILHIRDSLIFGEHNQKRHTPYIDWVWDREPRYNDVTVFTDSHLKEAPEHPSEHKIALLVEPPSVSGYAYEYILKNYHQFEYVFTYIDSILPLSKIFIPYTWGTPWIGGADIKISPKSKMTSAIVSTKNYSVGHKIRHEAVKRCYKNMDVMGLGYRRIENKTEGLAPYRYSLSIENIKIDTYFTEKLLDCFLTGVVPIYWGCSRIGDFFDKEGIIAFDKLEDLDDIFDSLSEEDYQKRMPAIQNNFNKALEYEFFEKPIYNFLKDIPYIGG